MGASPATMPWLEQHRPPEEAAVDLSYSKYSEASCPSFLGLSSVASQVLEDLEAVERVLC